MLCLRIIPTSYRLLLLSQNINGSFRTPNYTTIDAYDCSNELLQTQKSQVRNHFTTDFNLSYFTVAETTISKDISNMTLEEINHLIGKLLLKNQMKEAMKVISNCLDSKKNVSDNIIKDIFRSVSFAGKVDSVVLLQNYCSKVNPELYRRNGEFLHYLAKAQCMKGNSDKGLCILKTAYIKYIGLRNFYRKIFRELIHDSILNRSEASVVIFRKYVLQFSEECNDHYPLVCFWHICWSSDWFSDQMLSNDLLETSESLRDIVKDRSLAFSINILKEYNEDAVVRLLQSLLKYDMKGEYVKVLQVLFSYKLRNKDLKGCTEIIKNCEILGISLPSYQQGSYIKMLIDAPTSDSEPPPQKTSKNFKLKF